MMVKRYIISPCLMSLGLISFSSPALAQSQGFFDQSYNKSVQAMSPEEVKICEQFTEWSSKDPSSTVTDVLLQKSTLTLRCRFAHKSNKLNDLIGRYETVVKASSVSDLGHSDQVLSDNAESDIPAYFSSRMSPGKCASSTPLPKNSYTASARVGSLSEHKFSMMSDIQVDLGKGGNLTVTESLSGSFLEENTERSFVLSTDFIRLESEWDSSIENHQSVTIKSSKELPDSSTAEIELQHRTGGRILKASGQARTKYLGCMTTAGGGHSNLVQVEQTRIYPLLKAARDKNPNSIYAPIGSITYLYEVDSMTGYILSFAELDYTGNSIHILAFL